MAKNEIQRAAKQGGNRKSGKKAVRKDQLNVRIDSALLDRLRKLSQKTGRSQSWLVEAAICQTLEFNE